jgi:hypothetical protein
MTLQYERISLDLRPSGLQSTADLPQILPIWTSNRRGSPSNLGPSEPRTSHTRKTTEHPRSTRNTSEKLRNLGPLGSPLTQNASIASPKHIERPSYLESSQKSGKRLYGASNRGAMVNLCAEPHVPPLAVFPRWVHSTP